MKTEKKKSSRSLMLEILDWLGFRLKKLAGNRWDPKKIWQLVWKKSNSYTVFFVRHYDVPPFRRYESCFSLEKTKPKKTLSSCFAEFLGDVEMFELEDGDEDEIVVEDITSPVGWLKNPLFGCKSIEEMRVKMDLLISSSGGGGELSCVEELEKERKRSA